MQEHVHFLYFYTCFADIPCFFFQGEINCWGGRDRKISALVSAPVSALYEGQSKITEPYPITFELSKMDIYLDDISLKLYVIYLIT